MAEDSTPAVDFATLLRTQAENNRNKSDKRVKKETRLATVVEFMNDKDSQFVTVENIYPSGKPLGQIVQAFKAVIKENKLDASVWPIENNGHVYLVKTS